MGHKKRAPPPPPRTKSASTVSDAGDVVSGLSEIAVFGGSEGSRIGDDLGVGASYVNVKVECERALNALRRGNYNKAVRLIKEVSNKFERCGLVYRVQGTVCVKAASVIDDPNVKQRHLRNAVESARRAVELSPNSIEFGHFYANLLYELANESKEYEEVMQECEKALGIENPVDPAKESLQEESEQKISTAEGRISHVQAELKSLIQKVNISSISNWMKHFNGGEEKIRFIPLRRAVEDPMELKLVQTKRPNEIKKATKTPEERRKEIEVRVAAARLLQQQSESPKFQNGGENLSRNLDATSGSGNKAGERRKHGNARKSSSSIERKDLVHTYWNTINDDTKKCLLRVGVSELKSHFVSSKNGLASEILSQALSYAAFSKSWKFWTCCRCLEKFSDQDCHMHHVMQQHMGSLSPKLQSVMPQCVSDEWVEMILSCSWKPLDIFTVVRNLKNQSESKDHDPIAIFSDDSYPYENGFSSAWDDAPLDKHVSNDIYNVSAYGDLNYAKLPSDDVDHCDGNLDGSDGPVRAKLLERIHSMFEALIQRKCLAVSHLSKVIQFTMDEIQGLTSSRQLMQSGIDQSPECICFLGTPQLKIVIKYLQDISSSLNSGRYAEKGSLALDDLNGRHRVVNAKENLSLSEDGSLVLLNEGLLSKEPASLVSAAAPVSEMRNSSDIDGMLSWLYSGPAIDELLTEWMQSGEEKSHQGVKILQDLDKEFCDLQGSCERKCDNLGYEEALQMLEDLCLEDSKRRDNDLDFSVQSYDSVLKRRQEMLIQDERESGIAGNRFELDAIENVIKEAETLRSNQFGYNDVYGASHFHDIESGLDDDSRSKDYIDQMNTNVKLVFRSQKEQISLELSKLDAQILQSLSEMRRLELKLEPVSVHDYANIILPLVKSFLKAHLEDLAEKDATEKSDAVREALLAEIALDSKKGISGSDTRANQTKDKKKGKDYKRVKDTKGYSSHEQHTLEDKAGELISTSHMPKCGLPHMDGAVPGTRDELMQWDEEFKRQVELAAEEKKLEETLEYQRRIENEAKYKHITEKQRQYGSAALQKLPEECSYTQLQMTDSTVIANNNQDSLFQSDEVPHAIKSSLDKDMVDATKSYENGSSISQDIPMSHSHHVNNVKGRRGKRQQNPSKLAEGHDQSVPSEKGNAGFYSSEGQATEIVRSHAAFPDNEYNKAKTLRQLQAEDDDEERFQADLEKAVRQSLDAYEARTRKPSTESTKTVDSSMLPNGGSIVNECQVGIFGTGLKNETGEYNCFLNVIIQSLWHIRRFRDEFLRKSTSEHFHVGAPCVICALHDIFTSISVASLDNRREAVAPTSLRTALSNLYPNSNFFQEAQMNDASEVLVVIFDCLHQSYTQRLGLPDTFPNESNCVGSWDCSNQECIAHTIFGMNIFELMNCRSCLLESRYLKYTSFFHNINASALRTMKVMYADSSFDELLNFVEMNHQVACDPEAGGCGKHNYINHILSTPPHVFTTVLGWQNTCETSENIKATLAALSTVIDVGILYRGLDSKTKYNLVSVVCYYGQHYHCFAYSPDHKQWLMYDDRTVKMVGSWEEVLSMCERGHLQPQVLFFESAN